MEGGGSDVVSVPAAKPAVAVPAVKESSAHLGVMLALGVTLLAIWISELKVAPFTLAGGSPLSQ